MHSMSPPRNAQWCRRTRMAAVLTNVATLVLPPAPGTSKADTVFQVGVPPHRIDILTAISGVEFDAAWAARTSLEIGDLRVAVLSVAHLIENKRASGRPQDLVDVQALEGAKLR